MSIFTKVSLKRPPSNTFDLSHDKKLSFNIGQLIPVLNMEVVPGDRITLNSASMVRFMPLVSPAMQRFDVYIHYFFVPNRILWPNWESFITGGREGDDVSVAPYCEHSTFTVGSLADYMGLPTGTTGGNLRVSAFPIAGYNLIFQEYYQDLNLQNFVVPPLVDGDNTTAIPQRYSYGPLRRAYYKDYFTSALPWTQRGPEATIPLGTTAPIGFELSGEEANAYTIDGGNFTGNGTNSTNVDRDTSAAFGGFFVDESGGNFRSITLDNSQDLFADLSSATASSINDLRRAFRLQEFLERNARGGSRLTEVILSHFGVQPKDARLQRPEFIGGSRNPIQISEVLQTSSTDATTPQGNMAGHGIGVGNSGRFSYFVEEHGYIHAIMSVMPKASYMQGIPRHFTRWDRLSYYWPSFAQIGEQPILNQEIYADPSDGLDQDTFGYTPRYSEYKYLPSTVHGQFRTTLDFWHGARIFSARPALNSTFVQVDINNYNRLFSVTDENEQKLWAQVVHEIKARRPMPYFGTPVL